MSLKKKIAALLLATALVLPTMGLVSCGNDDGTETKPPISDIGDGEKPGDSEKPGGEQVSAQVTAEQWGAAFGVEAFKNCTIALDATLLNDPSVGESMITKFDYANKLIYDFDEPYASFTAKIDGVYYEFNNYVGGTVADEWNKRVLEDFTDERYEKWYLKTIDEFTMFADKYAEFTYADGKYTAAIFRDGYDEYKNVSVTFENGRVKTLVFDYKDTGIDDPDSGYYQPDEDNDYQHVVYGFTDYGTTVIEIPDVKDEAI